MHLYNIFSLHNRHNFSNLHKYDKRVLYDTQVPHKQVYMHCSIKRNTVEITIFYQYVQLPTKKKFRAT